jgi:hypothetical protein
LLELHGIHFSRSSLFNKQLYVCLLGPVRHLIKPACSVQFCPYEQRNLPFKHCISCNFLRPKISMCKRTIGCWGIQRFLSFLLNNCVFKDTYMTQDPCEKDMLTDISKRLINFTLKKSFGLYNFHYHQFTWISRENELQRKKYWNSFCAEARTGRWSSGTIHLLSENSYWIFVVIILRTISKHNRLKLPYYHQ